MTAIASFERDTRAPREPLPANSCDTHLHVFGDVEKYPPGNAHNHYAPPDARLEDAVRMHRALGISRAVLVQGSLYGTDNRLLIDALKQLPRNAYRGIALIDDATTDRALEDMHQAGVRGIRFSFWPRMGMVPTRASFERAIARVRGFGWHVKVFAPPDGLPELYEMFAAIPVPVLLDHLSNLDFRKGFSQPGFAETMSLLERDNWWVSLSNGDRWSATEYPWTDAEPFGRALYEAAPDRCVWGSDWPHLRYAKPNAPHEADLLDLLFRFLPDRAARQAVLADNPARLYGFV